MRLIAIDPGASGGIAWRDSDSKACCVPMPQTHGDLLMLLRERLRNDSDAAVYLEQLVKFAGPKLPGSTMAVYAASWGTIKGMVMALGAPLHLVNAKEWQKSLGFGRAKNGSKAEWKRKLRGKAQELYPHLEVTLKTADALLMLAYAEQLKTL